MLDLIKFICNFFFHSEKSVVAEKINENDDKTSNNRSFTEISIERNFLSLKKNLGIISKFQRVFAFPKIKFLPDIEKVLI